MFIQSAPFESKKTGKSKRRSRRAVRAALQALEPRTLLAATPIISEFLASNSKGLADRDGEYPDWIEIYNAGDEAVDLAGWSLTDKAKTPDKWVFPTTILDPGGFLIVMASGKDHRDAGAELHTNFKLGASGDYLALVRPDGTVASEFAPTYPPQTTNISYGALFESTTLVAAGAPALVKVPVNGGLEGAWNAPDYTPDRSWMTATTGVGYGVIEPGFQVHYVESSAPVTNLGDVNVVLANPSLWTKSATVRAEVINYVSRGADGGHYIGDEAFPTQNTRDFIDNFIIDVTGAVTIPTTGAWTFGVNSDDGFRLVLERDGRIFSTEHYGPRAPGDTLATFNLEAGRYDLRLLAFDYMHGAEVELFAAPGAHGSFDPEAFRLVGDVALGGLEVGSSLGGSVIETDIRGAMRGANATTYIRVPFQVDDPSRFDALTLRMRYDDGFVAYLNGVEVARDNAGGSLGFDSTATGRRDGSPMTPRSFGLSSFLSLLRPGENLLAIRGLNASAHDDDFLALPELIGSKLDAGQFGYFAEPTPGAPNGQAHAGRIAPVEASVGRGFFDAPFSVSLSTATPGAQIRYTLDGSEPTATHGLIYNGPLTIASTTALRFGAFAPGWLTPPAGAESYIFTADVIRQSPGGEVPEGWPAGPVGEQVFDYGMDPRIVNDPVYGPRLEEALKAIPSISLTTDLANLFDPDSGIYVNGQRKGRDWERPASLELIHPDGTPGFQSSAGVRIRGNTSAAGENPKHSFRFFFRSEYGASGLDYPLFGSEGVDSFKKIDIRAAPGNSWSFMGDPDGNFLAELYSRDAMRDLGQPYTRSRFYHLYVNGQYWGLYLSEERPDKNFAASYFGGDADDYDVIKVKGGPFNTAEATDGNLAAWIRLWNAVAGPKRLNLADDAAYFGLQGQYPDGSPNPGAEALVDVDNLIDYMLVIFHTGNIDGPITTLNYSNNFFAIRDRTGNGGGFKFIMRDAEESLLDVNENRLGPFPGVEILARFNPQFLHQQLMANAHYRLRFADRALRAFGPGGALSAEASRARFQAEADLIDQAIIAESARWGDAQRPDSPLTRDHWLAAVDRVLNDYMPYRTEIVWNQLREGGLYPMVAAPSFLVNGAVSAGGPIRPGEALTIAAPGGTIYYTTDGTDPRMLDGSPSPLARVYRGGPISLAKSAALTARALAADGSWSAAAQASFQAGVPAAAGNLAVTELNYNPAPGPEASDAQLFEFLELRNIGPTEIDLTGVRITEGVTFDFSGSAITSLAPGAYVLVVKDATAFAARFGGGLPVAGEYGGSLSNSGETITIVDAKGAVIESFTYSDEAPWPKSPDGNGKTLVRIDPKTDPDTPNNWRESRIDGGTPGNPDTNPPTISPLNDHRVEGSEPFGLPFTIGDDETPADALVVSVSSNNHALLPPGSLEVVGSGASRVLRITPKPGAVGSALITLTVVDGDGAVAGRTFSLIVDPLPVFNQPPIVAPIADASIQVGDHFFMVVPAFDPEGQPLEYHLAGGPPGATIDPNTGVVSWPTFLGLIPGRYAFDVHVTDGELTTPVTFHVNLNPRGLIPRPGPTPDPGPTPGPDPTHPVPPVGDHPAMATSWTVASNLRGTTINLAFSGPLDPAAAGDAGRYFVTLAGPDGRFGTRDDRPLPALSASYNPATNVVSLASRLRVPPRMPIRVAIADGALTDASGRAIDGDRDGVAGGALIVDLGGQPARPQLPPRPPLNRPLPPRPPLNRPLPPRPPLNRPLPPRPPLVRPTPGPRPPFAMRPGVQFAMRSPNLRG